MKRKISCEIKNNNSNGIQYYKIYNAIFKLKNLYRQGRLKRGIEDNHCESVADHSFGVALLSYIIGKENSLKLDYGKVTLLSLIHDLAESIVGDFTPGQIDQLDKIKLELDGIKEIFDGNSLKDEIKKLFEELLYLRSDEAKLVMDIDKVEMCYQAKFYEQQYEKDLSEFYYHSLDRVKSDICKKLIKELIER